MSVSASETLFYLAVLLRDFPSIYYQYSLNQTYAEFTTQVLSFLTVSCSSDFCTCRVSVFACLLIDHSSECAAK